MTFQDFSVAIVSSIIAAFLYNRMFNNYKSDHIDNFDKKTKPITDLDSLSSQVDMNNNKQLGKKQQIDIKELKKLKRNAFLKNI